MREPLFKIEHKKETVNGVLTKNYYVISAKSEQEGVEYRETALSMIPPEFVEFQKIVANFKID